MSRSVAGGTGDLELRDARAMERLPNYLRGIWARRHYIWFSARSDLTSRQMNSVLGNLWHLLNPLLQISVYFIVFGLLLDTRRGVDNFLGYLAIGVFVYGYSQKSVIAGGKSLIQNRNLIQIISFPRATLPITATVIEAIAMLAPVAIMLVAVVATGETPGPTWVLIAPFLLLQTVFNAGLAMAFARLASRTNDVNQLLPFVFRLGAYLSGVVFNVTAYVEHSSYETVFRLNPFYCFLEMNRGALLAGTDIDPALIATATAWTVGVVVFGFWWFRRAEDTYGQQ